MSNVNEKPGTLEGRVAIITGAGRGIGEAVAKLFAAQGAKVVLNDFGTNADGTGSDAGPSQTVADEINASGGEAIANGGDIADTATGEALVEQAVDTFGGLDIVVNIAGILRDKMIFNLSAEDWDAVIRVHMRGSYSTVRPASAYWRQHRNVDGNYRIINFTSGSGLNGGPGQPNYAAAKMGIVGFTYSLAQALGRYGVTANAVAPVAFTRLVASVVDEETMKSDLMQSVTAANIAPAVAYLASKESSWLTGRVLSATGKKIALMNNPDVVKTIETVGEWDLNALAKDIEASFRPLADGPPAPVHVF